MARKKCWIASLIAVGILSTVAARSVFADNGSSTGYNENDYNWKIYVGSEHEPGTVSKYVYFDTLEDLRESTAGTLGDQDLLRIFQDDFSLTEQIQLYVSGSAKIVSSGLTGRKILELAELDPAPGETPGVRRFLTATITPNSTLQIENLVFQNAYDEFDDLGKASNNRKANGGGAIRLLCSQGYLSYNTTLINTDFFDNKTDGSGGAIHVRGDTVNLTLKVVHTGSDEPTTMTFRGNQHLDWIDWPDEDADPDTEEPIYHYTANSIAFTNNWSTNFVVDTEENTLLDMQDPFQQGRTDTGTAGSFLVTKQGLGTWRLGGTNQTGLTVSSAFRIREGTLELTRDGEILLSGTGNTFQVLGGAAMTVYGGNTIFVNNENIEDNDNNEGIIRFDENSTLKFDFGFYAENDKAEPLLNLLAETIVLGYKDADEAAEAEGLEFLTSNIRLEIEGLGSHADGRNGKYLLVQGRSDVHIDITQVELSVDGIPVETTDIQHERFGYNLEYGKAGNIDDPTKLYLNVSDTDNTVLRWNGDATENEWNRDIENRNWIQVRNGNADSFISGDTVQFVNSGTHIINITQDVVIGHNTDNDTTGMHVSGDGHWTFIGHSILDNASLGRVSLLYDGSGSLTLANDAANHYARNVLAGTGTLFTARADLLGTEAILFADNKSTTETSKLHFTGATTLSTQLVAEKGGNGLVTVDNGYGVNLTITAALDETENLGSAVHVMEGGKLTIKADPKRATSGQDFGRIIFENNVGGESLAIPGRSGSGTVFVAEKGELVLENVEFRNNSAWRDGGAIATHGILTIRNGTFIGNTSPGSEAEEGRGFGGAISTGGTTGGSTTTIIDSTFIGNLAGTAGGAIAAGVDTGESLRLTIGATDGGTTLFSGNLDGLIENPDGNSNAVYLTGSGRGVINLNIDTVGSGTVDMRDAVRAENANFSLNVTKTGAGTWKLAGDSVFQAQRGTTFTIKEGALDLYRGTDTVNGIVAGSITIDTGTLEIAKGGALVSRGGNSVTAERIKFADGAILGFDLDRLADVKYPYSDPLLQLTATNAYDFAGGRQIIDIVGLSTIEDDGFGTFNLAEFVGYQWTDANVDKLQLLFHGEDISMFRQSMGTLQKSDTDDSILQVVIHETQNGATQWTNKDGNSVWNGQSTNWAGTAQGVADITGTTQFLHGDAVVFTNVGAGRVEVNAGGVEIADQKLADGTVVVGMTVENFNTTDANNETVNNDYVFHGGSISGNAGLLKRGTGTLTFEQENHFNGDIVVEGGTLAAKKAGSLGTGNVLELMQHDTVVQFDIVESGTYGAQITGNGSFVKSGGGSLQLSNENDYLGGTTILGGELVALHATSFGTGPLVTGIDEQSGTAVFDLNPESYDPDDPEFIPDPPETFAHKISGTGGVKNIGVTALILSGDNRYSGGTLNETGATLIAKKVTAFGTGDVVNRGELVFDLLPVDSGTFSQNISGTGDLRKTGEGKLTLTGNNTYTGDTLLESGELYLNSETAAAGSIIRFGNGYLAFGDVERATIGGLDGDSDDVSLSSPKGYGITLTINQTKTDEKPTFSGALTGDGAVIKDGAGTQVFAGTNTYSGGTLIRSGRLTAGIDGLGTGDVINNAELEFIVKEDGNFANKIVGTGAVYKTGEGILELTGSNTYSGGTFIGEGHLVAHSLDAVGSGNVVISGTEASFTLDLATDAELTREISGAGDFYKAGEGNLFVEGAFVLQGTTHIVGGTLYLNGTSSSETIVYDGGTLSGTGVLDNTVTFRQGASHRVGHQVNGLLSTFTAKELAYEDGSRIYIKVGKNGSDQVVAKDGIDFARGGGNVEVVLINLGLDDFDEDSAPANRYEVIVSENNQLLLDGTSIANHASDDAVLTVDGVDGSVSFVSGKDEGLGVLGYEVKTNADSSKSIFLDVSVTEPGAVGYLDWNQRTILQGLGDVDAFNRIYSASKDERGQVINYLMPQLQTVMPYLAQRAVTQFNAATYERLRFLRGPRSPFAMNDTESRSYRAQVHRPANDVWFQTYGDFLKMNRQGSVSEFRADSYGFNLGFDRGVDPCSTVGLGMGGYFSEVKANDVHQEGEANSFLISLYGNRYGHAGWLLTGSTGFVFSSYEIDRYADPFETKLHSRHDGMTVFASVEASKKLLLGHCEVAPYLGMDLIWLGEDGYTEKASGAYDSLALKVRYQSTWTFLTSLGVRVGRPYRMLGGNVFHPTLYAAWVHDWTESDIATRASFAGMPSFKVRGASMNRDRAQLGMNLNMTLSSRTDMFARFNAELARRYSDVSVHWGIRLGF